MLKLDTARSGPRSIPGRANVAFDLPSEPRGRQALLKLPETRGGRGVNGAGAGDTARAVGLAPCSSAILLHIPGSGERHHAQLSVKQATTPAVR